MSEESQKTQQVQVGLKPSLLLSDVISAHLIFCTVYLGKKPFCISEDERGLPRNLLKVVKMIMEYFRNTKGRQLGFEKQQTFIKTYVHRRIRHPPPPRQALRLY